MDSKFLIGHLDTGSPPDHPRLNGKIFESITFKKNGILAKKESKSRQHSHSSLSTRIIFEDKYYSLPPLNDSSKLAAVSIPSHGKTLLNILKGMDHLIDLAPQIICMPIGFRKPIPIFYPMISAFYNKGIHTIIPVGNNGVGIAHVPGCYPNVISVGAIDATGKVARYSGSYLDDSGNCLKPDILALGNSLPIAGKKSKKGTSFACSYIAGVVARLLQVHPEATPEAIKQALFSNTLPLPPKQSHRCKRGIVQPDAALEYLRQNKELTSSFEPDLIPNFLLEPYQDNRFLFQCRNAKSEQLIEAIIIPLPSQEKTKDLQIPSPRSHDLITQTQNIIGLAPDSIHFFTHADMAHVVANPTFFEALLNNPNLFSISAVDVNIFEM